MSDSPATPLTPQSALEIEWQLVDSTEKYSAALETLATYEGPFAIDTERASGYRYFQKAYLVQIKRAKSKIYLFDPTAFSDFSALAALLRSDLWILHSGQHDLPCLADLGLKPQRIFDTELAARLLGLQRVGLGKLVADLLHVDLDKAFSNVDWSERPLDKQWLEYAAIDVEFLEPLMQILLTRAITQDKLDIFAQEFSALQNFCPPTPKPNPWRRVSRISELGADRMALAIVRELWYARDSISAKEDLAPHRVLEDRALIQAAVRKPRSQRELLRLSTFKARPLVQANAALLWAAVARARKKTIGANSANLDDNRLSKAVQMDTTCHGYAENIYTQQQNYSYVAVALDKEQQKHLRKVLRAAILESEIALSIEAQTLLDTAILKKLAADPPAAQDSESIAKIMLDLGARPWQVREFAQKFTKIFRENLQ